MKNELVEQKIQLARNITTFLRGKHTPFERNYKLDTATKSQPANIMTFDFYIPCHRILIHCKPLVELERSNGKSNAQMQQELVNWLLIKKVYLLYLGIDDLGKEGELVMEMAVAVRDGKFGKIKVT